MRESLSLPLSPANEDPWFWSWRQDYRSLGKPLGEDAVSVYGAMWRKYVRYLDYQGVRPEQVTADRLLVFFESLTDKQRGRYLSLLRKVYANAVRTGLSLRELPEPWLPKKPARRTAGEALTETERHQVLTALAPAESEQEGDPRAKALVAVLLGAGLRLEEALNIRPPESGYVFVPEMKGRPSRAVPLEPACVPPVERWLGYRTTPLFPSLRGTVMSATTAWRTVSGFLAQAGLAGSGPEQLRATWLVHQLRTQDAGVVAQLAGIKDAANLVPYIRQARP
jgi:integrase